MNHVLFKVDVEDIPNSSNLIAVTELDTTRFLILHSLWTLMPMSPLIKHHLNKSDELKLNLKLA